MVAEVVEAVWMITAILGTAGSAVMLYITKLQVQALKGAVNGRRRQLFKNIRNEVGRSAMFVINMAIGVFALATPNETREAASNAVSLIAYLFIIQNIINMVNVVLDAHMAIADLRGGDPFEQRDHERDTARDSVRDPLRDAARDVEHDA